MDVGRNRVGRIPAETSIRRGKGDARMNENRRIYRLAEPETVPAGIDPSPAL